MSNLEQGMRHAGKRLIEGKHHRLSAYEQVIVATWMTKTAVLYDAARGEQIIPLEAGCRRFYRTGMPLPQSQVVIGAFQPPNSRVVIPHRRKEHKLIDPATGNVAYHAVDVSFTFGFLFIQVYINSDETPSWFGVPGAHPDLIQCWPVRHPIAWEPPLYVPPAPGRESDPQTPKN
jgi:hypothetical protein